MEIKRASEMGFCFGVRRALDLVWKAIGESGHLQSLGAIVHNQKVAYDLEQIGVTVARSLDEVTSDTVVVTSHGVGPNVIKNIQDRGLKIVDTTCPHVKKAQNIASKLADEGYSITIFGEEGHPEVQGLLGWSDGKGMVAADWSSLSGEIPNRLGIISQTTQSPKNYAEFVKYVVSRLSDISELRVFSTICEATRKRLASALELSEIVDVMIVVGGINSSNTNRLAEACLSQGVTTYHIEQDEQIEASWFKSDSRVGVTAGASTPDIVIDSVIEKLESVASVVKQS
ncbi:4-hydroxy-3-methylbut-2-enyl diphosphate reductase [Chloroflexota bacterium]